MAEGIPSNNPERVIVSHEDIGPVLEAAPELRP